MAAKRQGKGRGSHYHTITHRKLNCWLKKIDGASGGQARRWKPSRHPRDRASTVSKGGICRSNQSANVSSVCFPVRFALKVQNAVLKSRRGDFLLPIRTKRKLDGSLWFFSLLFSLFLFFENCYGVFVCVGKKRKPCTFHSYRVSFFLICRIERFIDFPWDTIKLNGREKKVNRWIWQIRTPKRVIFWHFVSLSIETNHRFKLHLKTLDSINEKWLKYESALSDRLIKRP